MTHHHHQDSTSSGQDTQDSRYKATVRVTIIGAIIDFFLGVAKILVGSIANSQALIADGVHSLSDLATDFVVLYAAKHSSQDADEAHPYGHGRIETVATVGLGVALVIVAAGIVVDAIQRMLDPESLVVPGFWALVIAAISVVSKEAIYQYTMAVARRYRSKMLEANAWHSRSDAISSIVVLVGIAGSMAGYRYLDAVAAIGVGIMIAKIGWDLCFHSIQELVDTALEEERVKAIKSSILAVDGVVSLHILRTRRMGSDALVDVHIQVQPDISVSEAHYISERVRLAVIKEIEEVADVMVHIDPEDDEHIQFNAELPMRTLLSQQLQNCWSEIPEAKQIDRMALHYLDGKIRIELLLPFSVLEDLEQGPALQALFETSAQTLKDIESVSLRFH
ncbi:MAG: cation diffusion facilitator family transporter [Gammaproteobacteria bacterium]|nr:cation diffusion facilitator family transporter [Gammaproteobacteria bacterium]